MFSIKRVLAVSAVIATGLVASQDAQAADQATPAPAVKAKPKAPDVPFFFVNDNRLTYAYIFQSADAGSYSFRPNGSINGKTAQQVLAYTQFDV